MEVKAVVCLFWISVQRVSSLQERPETKQDVASDTEVDFERLENEYAVSNVSIGTEVYENITIPEILIVSTENPETKSDNVTDFRPSWHLGEIEEFKSAYSNPFNKLSHLKFDNSFSDQPKVENWYIGPQSNNEANHLNRNNVNHNVNLAPPEQKFFSSSISIENPYFRIHNNGASFPRVQTSVQTQNVIPTSFQNPPQIEPTLFQRPEFPVNLPDKTYFDTTYVQEVPQPAFDRPVSSFHDEANFVSPFNDVQNFDYVKSPSFESYVEPNALNVHSEIQEILPARNQRFPYKFHQETPTFMDGNLEHFANEHAFQNVPRQRRISPWKKIIHLIGTILPFGLLLATLTPNVVQISNSTQSTIPLSKLKDVNLPPEHKSFRMSDDDNNCEEKNICEVILAGSKPKSNLLQNILWNFVMRTSEKTAKDNGLLELFEAIKKRDCNLITC